jgi:hypothetical protein
MAPCRLGCGFAASVSGIKHQFCGNNGRYSFGSIGSSGKIFSKKSKIRIAGKKRSRSGAEKHARRQATVAFEKTVQNCRESPQQQGFPSKQGVRFRQVQLQAAGPESTTLKCKNSCFICKNTIL